LFRSTGIITVRVPESLGLGDLREQYDELAAQIGRSHRLQVVLDAETAVLVGDCAAIAQLGEVRQCPSGPREWDAVLSSANQLGTALIRGYGTILVSGEPHLSTQVPPGGAVAGLLVVDEDGDQDVAEVARAAFTTLGIVDVHASGQYAIGGEAAYRRAVLWLVPFLSAGLLLLLFATILGALDVFALQARNLGPIGAISGATRFYVSVAVWNIGTALVLSTIVGAGLAVWLAFLFVRLRTTSPPLPWPTVGAGAGVLLLLAFVMVVWCGIVATRAARRWHPVNDSLPPGTGREVRHVGAAGPVRPPLRDARQLRRLITTKATVTTASWQNMSSASTMCTGAPTAIAAAATPVRGRAHRPRWARARVRMALSRSSPVRVAARSKGAAVCGLVADRHNDRPATAIAIRPPTRSPLPMFPGPYSRSRRPPDTSTVIAAARPSARAIRCRVADSVDMEDLLNGGPEVARDGDGQRQG